jgi:hypothetical protein
MADHEKDRTEEFWYRGKVTRRRLIGYDAAGAGALGATMLVPAPWQGAFGQAKPYKIPAPAAAVRRRRRRRQDRAGRHQMAVDRINKSGGINGRPIELDRRRLRSSPTSAVARPKLVVEDKIDIHEGGFLSNVLPCLPAGVRRAEDRHHDRRVPRHHAHHQQVQPLHLPAVRLCAGPRWFAPALVNMGKWHTRLPTTPGASRRAMPMWSRSRRRAARSSAPPASRSAPPT